MATITENQRRSYLASAHDAARTLSDRLHHVSPAERFAIWATIAALARIDADAVMVTDEPSDAGEVAAVLDGVLSRGDQGEYSWRLYAGSHAVIEPTTRGDHS